ncbi:VOC family protein [Sphingomonas sanxanigenens]|uniref:VOC domain-containing protein n=1 Tax=Sphingomonas sanxanigenens DSM 19645 = NX02 TaxID=1123269 RepID=W0A7T5_9SPHN|nr:VOC family protein [Sphingomonas sanxanigenens]AHE52527.1 hypothetical protein NX02_03870 [Sphingomonas sanxanigenens DSM 19645 = NX02]
MFVDAQPVGFVSTTETERARRFYTDVMGLSLADDGFALVASVGGGKLRITTLPAFAPSEMPCFGFLVPDVTAAVRGLAAKGLAFIRYDFLGDAQDADGIWNGPDGAQVAWFKDPDGNLLSIGPTG